METYSDHLRRLADMLDDDFCDNARQVVSELLQVSRWLLPSEMLPNTQPKLVEERARAELRLENINTAIAGLEVPGTTTTEATQAPTPD